MDFNLEQFVTDYVAALKDNNTDELIKLIDTLTDDAKKTEALEAIIAVLEADKDLVPTALLALDDLKETQEKNKANAVEAVEVDKEDA